MLSYSTFNQMINLLTFDIFILIISAIRTGSLWFDRNVKPFQVVVGSIIDPMILLSIFILCLISYILCIRGEEKLHKPSFIPYFIVTPIKIALVLVLSGISFGHEASCSEWLSSWECLCYPFVGIAWSLLNVYLFVIILKRYKEIDKRIKANEIHKEFTTHNSCPGSLLSNHEIMKLHSHYQIIDEQKNAFS